MIKTIFTVLVTAIFLVMAAALIFLLGWYIPELEKDKTEPSKTEQINAQTIASTSPQVLVLDEKIKQHIKELQSFVGQKLDDKVLAEIQQGLKDLTAVAEQKEQLITQMTADIIELENQLRTTVETLKKNNQDLGDANKRLGQINQGVKNVTQSLKSTPQQ